jgi:hypothetical protein
VSGLRRRTEASRRRRFEDPGVSLGEFSKSFVRCGRCWPAGVATGSCKLRSRAVRSHGVWRRQDCWCTCGVEVLRSSSAVPSRGDMRARRNRSGSLDAGRLGRRHEPFGSVTGRSAAASRDEREQVARRRHGGPGAGAGVRKNKAGASVDLCARRPARRTRNSSGSVVRLHAEPKGGASQGTFEQLHRHAAGGCVLGVRPTLPDRTHSGSGLLGVRAEKVLTIFTSRTNRRWARKRSGALGNSMPSRKTFRTTAQRTPPGAPRGQPAAAGISGSTRLWPSCQGNRTRRKP